MKKDDRPLTLKGMIEPEHLLQAIANSLEHCDETDHGTTGLYFPNYSIIVHKRKGFAWTIECRFKHGDTTTK